MLKYNEQRVFAVEDLDDLLDKLEPGMVLQGRILEKLMERTYILRIRGYNVVMESDHPFREKDEVRLHVEAVSPRLLLSLKPLRRNILDPDKGIADILVH